MNQIRAKSLSAVSILIIAAMVGCNKKEDAAPPAGATTAPAAAAPGNSAVTEADLIGTWKGVRIETAAKGDLPKWMIDEIKSTIRDFHADHSAITSSTSGGSTPGAKWSLNGSTVVYTIKARGSDSTIETRFELQKDKLVEITSPTLSIFYEKQSGPSAPPAADFTVTDVDLLKELDADSKAASAKYKNKTLQIAGTIVDMDSSFGGSPIVRLAGGPRVGLECWLNDEDPWGHLALGQKITLRGKVDLDFSHRVTGCTIVDSGPSTAVTTTAAAMAGDYKAGADAFEKKYKGKTVVVEGDVAKKEATTDGSESTIVWLKGTGDLNIGCTIYSQNPTDKTVSDKINTGDHLIIAGTCNSTPATGKWLVMSKRVSH